MQKAKEEAARANNALLVARARLNTLTAGHSARSFPVQRRFRQAKQSLNADGLTAQALEQLTRRSTLSKLAEQADHTLRF